MAKEIVEINGVRFEVDLDKARKITEFRVGDQVKVLKKSYSDTWEAYPGVVIGFDAFQNLPTINIVYIETSYSSCDMKHVSFNEKAKDYEIAPCVVGQMLIEKSRVIDMLNNQIEKKRLELQEAELKKSYFENLFGKFYESISEQKEQVM